MIAKYPGTCRYCKKPIEVGRDEYDTATKTNWHQACREKQDLFTSSEREELAERLGYRKYEWSELNITFE